MRDMNHFDQREKVSNERMGWFNDRYQGMTENGNFTMRMKRKR